MMVMLILMTHSPQIIHSGKMLMAMVLETTPPVTIQMVVSVFKAFHYMTDSDVQIPMVMAIQIQHQGGQPPMVLTCGRVM